MARSAPLIDLANEFPLLEVEVRSASQAEAVRLMHEGSVHLALVFERPASMSGKTFSKPAASD